VGLKWPKKANGHFNSTNMDEEIKLYWAYYPKGQYVDEHEWEDVVDYRQNVFLPCWANIKACI